MRVLLRVASGCVSTKKRQTVKGMHLFFHCAICAFRCVRTHPLLHDKLQTAPQELSVYKSYLLPSPPKESFVSNASCDIETYSPCPVLFGDAGITPGLYWLVVGNHSLLPLLPWLVSSVLWSLRIFVPGEVSAPNLNPYLEPISLTLALHMSKLPCCSF